MMNRIFVAYKPSNISSNAFLQSIKKKYGVKKAGYSGTLDPFAKGVLIIAFNNFTRLFRFLNKVPKMYEATIWLGVKSLSFDDKNIIQTRLIPAFKFEDLAKIIQELSGTITFTPPQFSAKRIKGKRAYEFAKRGEQAPLKECQMQIFSSQIVHYNHPFLTLRLSVSEGAYVRSYCEILAQKLGVNATLSSLERLSEGKFVYENEKNLNILDFLALEKNALKDNSKLENGTKITLNELKIQKNGEFIIEDEKFFSIISVKDNVVKYLLNKVAKC